MVLLANLHFRQPSHCSIRTLACLCMSKEAVKDGNCEDAWMASVDITISRYEGQQRHSDKRATDANQLL